MKRLVAALLVGIALVLILPYFYVPSIIRKRLMAVVPVKESISRKVLLYEDRTLDWWPAQPTVANDTHARVLTYKGHSYRIANKTLAGFDIYSSHNGDTSHGRIAVLPIGHDSTAFTWEYDHAASLNPITRMLQYNRAKVALEDMSFLLQEMSNFLMDESRVYHIKVERVPVTDSLLLTTKAVFTHDPSGADIYKLIGTLHQYSQQHGATAINPPMLHQQRLDSTRIEVMVGLPVNKRLADKGSILFKQMVPLTLLSTTVKGGPEKIRRAFRQLSVYVTDHQYTSPAIPFESLVTDRLQEPDTSKWVTRIYYPVL